MVIDTRNIPTETFFQFGQVNPPYRYLPDSLGEKPLRKTIHHIGKMIHVLNAHSTKTTTNMPEARQELPNANLEAIYCQHCHSYLPMRRVHATITQNPSLSPRTSQYLTQPLAYCECSQSAMMVDHRGLLRVYGYSTSLVNYLEGFPIHHRLDAQTHLQVPTALLDSKKPRYERLVMPRYLWLTSLIDLSNMPKDHRSVILPMPVVLDRQYYQSYAYNHRVFILTTKYLVLPSGISISLKEPYLKSLLTAPMERPNYLHNTPNMCLGVILRAVKRNYEHIQAVNQLLQELNDKLIAHYQLPDVQPSLYPHQTIGYLQVAYSNLPRPVYRGNKIYLPPADVKPITMARSISRRILRNLLNEKSVDSLLKELSIRPFAKIAPAVIYMKLHKPLHSPNLYLGRNAPIR